MTKRYEVRCQGYKGYVCVKALAYLDLPDDREPELPIMGYLCEDCALEDARLRPPIPVQIDRHSRANEIAKAVNAGTMTVSDAIVELSKLVG